MKKFGYIVLAISIMALNSVTASGPVNENSMKPSVFSNELIFAVPNENWEIILLFNEKEFRLFKAMVAIEQHGFLSSPRSFKAFSFDHSGVEWKSQGVSLTAQYLYENSIPTNLEKVKNQSLRLGYQNQAPTVEDRSHHVYGVFLSVFNKDAPFSLGESIGGGFADRGGSRSYSYEELIKLPDWKEHFMRSGCSWAVELVESDRELPEILAMLVEGAKKTNGMPDKSFRVTEKPAQLSIGSLRALNHEKAALPDG